MEKFKSPLKYFAEDLMALVQRNEYLEAEVERLLEVERQYHDYVYETSGATSKVTDAWVGAILRGQVVIANPRPDTCTVIEG